MTKKRRYADRKLLSSKERGFVRRHLGSDDMRHLIVALGAFQVALFGYALTKDILTWQEVVLGGSVFAALYLLMYIYMQRVSNQIFSSEFENALFAGAANAGMEFLLIVREDLRVVYFSPACRDYFGYDYKEPHDTLYDILKQWQIDGDLAYQFVASLQARKEEIYEFELSKAGGDKVPLEVVIKPIGRPRGYTVIKAFLPHHDPQASLITEAELAQAASVMPDIRVEDMNMARDAFSHIWQHVLRHAPTGVALLDRQGNVHATNPAFANLLPPVAREQSKISIYDICTSQAQNRIHQRLQRKTLSSEAAAGIDVQLADSGDRTVELFIVGPYQEGLSEQVAGSFFVAYVLEAGDQQHMEERMIHSQRMQAVGQLAGGVAHDFNNLLTAMIGFCDLLLTRHAPGDASFGDIMQIKQNANRAANLVRQLLAFSRKQTLQPKVVDLTEVLSEITNLLRRLLGANVELAIEHDRELWPVCVDPGQLEQVIINLAVNARDAMEGSGALSISTRNTTIEEPRRELAGYVCGTEFEDLSPGDYVAIDVHDTGCGMSATVVQQIFEPFFTTKGVGEGTGLGLATVLGIVEQTGGHILVKSMEGEGTTFRILLEKHEVTEAEQAAEERNESRDLTGSEIVLLVEDETPVRMFASRALANKGYEVLEAETGEEGLAVFNERGTDIQLIITDVMMPGMTGPEMVKEIRKSQGDDIPVIFISGYGEDEFIKTFGDTRRFEFLPKPFSLNDLAAKVKDVLE